MNRVSSWKQFLIGQPYPVTRPWPESVSEVSAECEFPVCLIKINVMAEVSSPTREICNSLSLSTQKWVMTDCPLRQEKAASEDFVTSRCSSNPTLSFIQWRKPTKVKAVHKVRNKDLVLPLVLGWHFWDSSPQAENKTGSFDETAGYRTCRFPQKLCSMWSLRVTNFARQVRRRSGWRVARGVHQKCQKTEKNVYRWQCTIQGFTAMHYTVKS